MATVDFAIKPLKSSAPLSKSKFVHGMQCPLYLWLEVRTDAPRLEPDAFTQALFAAGNEVGEYARRRWDRRQEAQGRSTGVRIPDAPELHAEATEATTEALATGADVIHEAAFTHGGVKVRVDVLERLSDGTFAINEVKSSSHYEVAKHLLDAAVQLWVLRGCGLQVSQVRLVHLNGDYLWPGGDYDLEQLFTEDDITEAAIALEEAVGADVARLLRVVQADQVPIVSEDVSCTKPYGCPYSDSCPVRGVRPAHPVGELPNASAALVKRARERGCESLLDLDELSAREVLRYADGRPHDVWFCTWQATNSGERLVLGGCQKWLASLEYPIRHLDFETIASPLPVVTNTTPFQQVPLQYSIHTEYEDGTSEHTEFIADADDPDPRRSLVERLLADLGQSGTILRWSPFETTIIKALASNPEYAAYADELGALLPRIQDLGHAVRDWVFDAGFCGSWSIKKVYPTLVPGGDPETVHDGDGVISYDELDGVARGDEAAMALLEYLRSTTTADRRAEIRRQLLQYCELDTWAMVEVLGVLRAECAQR